MSGRAPYSRVYWSIVDDERFTAVYDDNDALSTWLRLLLIADQAHPASAHLPFGVDAAALDLLKEAGLIEVKGSRYRIHGLDAERERRARRTQEGAAPEPDTSPNGKEQVPNRSPVMPSRARAPRLVSSSSSSSPGGGPGEGLPHLDSAVATMWERATGRSILSSGVYSADYLDDACRRHTITDVCVAVTRARSTFDHIPDGPSLIAAMRPLLDPFPDGKATAKADRDREERESSRRRTEATLIGNHKVGGHEAEPNTRCPMCVAVTA